MSTVWDDAAPPPAPRWTGARAGVLGGLFAGTVTAVAALARSASLGLGFWSPAKAVAAAATGLPALVGDGATVSAGFGIHMALSALYGLLLGLALPRRRSAGAALVLGVAWGAVLWLVGTWVLLPAFNEVQLDRVRLVPGSWLVAHLMFGGLAGFSLHFTGAGRPGAARPSPDAPAHRLGAVTSLDDAGASGPAAALRVPVTPEDPPVAR